MLYFQNIYLYKNCSSWIEKKTCWRDRLYVQVSCTNDIELMFLFFDHPLSCLFLIFLFRMKIFHLLNWNRFSSTRINQNHLDIEIGKYEQKLCTGYKRKLYEYLCTLCILIFDSKYEIISNIKIYRNCIEQFTCAVNGYSKPFYILFVFFFLKTSTQTGCQTYRLDSKTGK